MKSKTKFKQTETCGEPRRILAECKRRGRTIGEIPEGWEDMPLADMAELIKDGYRPTGSDHLLYIGLEHINQQSLSLNSIGHSTEVESNKFVFQSGDILFGKLRPYFRKVYRPRFNGVCSTDIWVVRAKDDIDQGFLFYFMANRDFVDLASSGSSGTRMPRADWGYLKETSWKKPPINEQRAIAKILSDLDAKIELNHQMNKTLESIAQAIFKQWFVDFEFPGYEKTKFVNGLPEGWREGKFGELTKIQPGFAFKSADFTSSGYKVIKIANIQNGIVDFAQSDHVTGAVFQSVDKKFHLASGDVIIAMTGAEIGWAHKKTRRRMREVKCNDKIRN